MGLAHKTLDKVAEGVAVLERLADQDLLRQMVVMGCLHLFLAPLLLTLVVVVEPQ